MTIKADIQSLSPGAVVEMFELDATNIPGGTISYFHAGTNELSKPVVWQGITYSPLPIEAEGFDITTNGTLPRPRFRVANVGGIFSAVARENEDLVGCKVTRRRTFAKYLDAENWQIFTGGSPKPSNGIGLHLSTLDSGSEEYVGKVLRIYSGPGSVQDAVISDYVSYATGAQWKQNLLRYSNILTNASWIKPNVTVAWDDSEKAHTMTVVTNSSSVTSCYQNNTAFSPSGKQITAQAWVKGIGSMLGKQVRVYTYKDAALEPIQQTITLTANWQLLKLTRSFSTNEATMLTTRFDFALPATAGDSFYIKDAQVFEGSESAYVETTEAIYPGPAVLTEQPLKQNMLAWSNNGTSSVWGKNNVSVTFDSGEDATKITVTNASDPYIYQGVSYNKKRAKITFSVEVKALGTGIGKQGALYVLRSQQGSNVAQNDAQLFNVTSDWQKIIFEAPEDPIGSTSFTVRLDFPQVGAAIGDELLFRNAHVYEGVGATYVETSATRLMPVDTSSGYSILIPNGANSSPDPNQHFPDDIWFVEQKINENKYIVEWELASVFDLQGVMLPARQIIQDSCPWKYRGAECGYTGTAYFDLNDQVTTQSNDFCAKHLSSCKKRFPNQPLPFGGFPGAVRFVV